LVAPSTGKASAAFTHWRNHASESTPAGDFINGAKGSKPAGPWSRVARRYTPLGLGNLIIGIFYVGVAGQLVEMQWSLFEVVWVIAFVLAGNLLWFSIMLLGGTMSFWITRPNALRNLVIGLYELTRYPLSIYGPYLKGFLTFIVPYAFVAHYPAPYLLGKSEADGHWGAFSPLVAALLFAATYQFWKRGLSSYQSTGS